MNKTLIALALSTALLGGTALAKPADISALLVKAESGDAYAMYEVGQHYLSNGEVARGMLYLEHIIRSGDPNGAYAHGALARHYEGLGDGAIARNAMMYHYRQAAVMGEVSAQVRLGSILLELASKAGNDLSLKSQHRTQAQVLLEHAANEGGSDEASYVLGSAYLRGMGLDRDVQKAETWLAKAAGAQHMAAAYMLATHAKRSGQADKAERNFKIAAAAGHGQAMLDLATGYESGEFGDDPKAAAKWIAKAVEAKVSGASAMQANLVQKQRAREEEAAQAKRLAELSRRQSQRHVVKDAPVELPPVGNDVDALRQRIAMLSQMVEALDSGDGRARHSASQYIEQPLETPKEPDNLTANQKGLDAHARGEYKEAYRYFARAARRGDADAMNNMGMLLLQGRGVDPDPVKAMDLFRDAAKSGHVTAAHNIGYMYENALGVRQDIARSRVWYQHATSLARRAAYTAGI